MVLRAKRASRVPHGFICHTQKFGQEREILAPNEKKLFRRHLSASSLIYLLSFPLRLKRRYWVTGGADASNAKFPAPTKSYTSTSTKIRSICLRWCNSILREAFIQLVKAMNILTRQPKQSADQKIVQTMLLLPKYIPATSTNREICVKLAPKLIRFM